jgi:hypothetical protein
MRLSACSDGNTWPCAGPLDVGGGGPADRSHTLVTRRYWSGMPSFAAHSPEGSDVTEDPVLRASNGRNWRGCSSPDRRECARSPWLSWSLSVLSTADPMPVDPALTSLWPQDRSSGLHGPALPDMDFRNRASSNVLSNFVSESGSTDFVNDLFRLQAEAAGDDLLLDLSGVAEARYGPVVCVAHVHDR